MIARRALIAVLALTIISGCSGTAVPTSTPAAVPTAAPTPTAGPSIVPSPAVITGTMTATVPDVPEWGSGGFPGFGGFEVGDARATGDYRTVINWGADDPQNELVRLWGTSIIWNDGGTWQGPWTGWRTYGGDHVIDSSMTGSGEYAGLTLSYHATAPTDDSVWQVTMSIEAAPDDVPSASPTPGQDGVSVTGVRSCAPAPLGNGDALGSDPPAGRAEVTLCAWDVSDDRLTGTDTTLANVNTQTGGPIEGWGSISLRSSANSSDDAFCGWLGSYSLQAATDGSTTTSVELAGLGTCEGLSYSGQEAGTGEQRTVNGVISGTAANPVSTPTPTPRATGHGGWPFVRTSCPDFPGVPWLLVALGTSESAGPGEYPEQYADMLCAELDVPVELHGYYPTGDGLAPLAWWIAKATTNATMRADLAAADEVVLWALSSHDVVPPLLFGECLGAWPDPLKPCLEEATADIPARNDELFGVIAGLVRHDAVVLAGDAYVPPAVVRLPWFDEPYGPEVSRLVDPYFVVEPLAAEHGFIFVDTELVFNGPGRRQMPADGLFLPDGLHPTVGGAILIAQTYAAADGLGD